MFLPKDERITCVGKKTERKRRSTSWRSSRKGSSLQSNHSITSDEGRSFPPGWNGPGLNETCDTFHRLLVIPRPSKRMTRGSRSQSRTPSHPIFSSPFPCARKERKKERRGLERCVHQRISIHMRFSISSFETILPRMDRVRVMDRNPTVFFLASFLLVGFRSSFR